MGTSIQFNAAIASLMLFLIALIHGYWGLGGKKGIEMAVPTENGKPLFQPGKWMTLGMGVILAEAGLIQMDVAIPGIQLLPPELIKLISAVFGCIFLVRALFGFILFTLLPTFRNSVFARWDRQLYSPVCVYLGFSFVWVWLVSPGL